MKKRVVTILASLAGLAVILGVVIFAVNFRADREKNGASDRTQQILDKNVSAGDAVWSKVELEETYRYGQTLQIPERQVSLDGNEAAVTAVLTYPDGTATLKPEAVLDMVGVYKLTYTAKNGAKTAQTEETFLVPQETIQVGVRSVKQEYGSSPYGEDVKGVGIRLAPGEAVEFAQTIDLSQATLNDILAKIYVIPSVLGASDFNNLIFRLTDVEDPDNYLTIQAHYSADGDDYPFTYISAGGDSQPLAGYSSWENRIFTNTVWGTSITVSFSGNYARLDGNVEQGQYYIGLSYDREENALYASSGERDYTLVADFDDLKYFDTAWEGFQSGKVRMSITADGYKSSFAHIFVAEVKDCDLSVKMAEDQEPPVITVEQPYETMPDARIGYSYPVLSATAKDAGSGNCEISTAVFYNYQSGAPVSISVKDGRFATDREGWYTIVYTASDYFGNTAEKDVWLYAGQSDGSYAVRVPEEGKTLTSSTGETVAVAEYETEGGCGDSTVQIRVTMKDEEIPVKDGVFRPEKAGIYTVRYSAVDYVGQTAEASYEVSVKDSADPVFVNRPVLPRYLISGSSYELPECQAYTYKGNKKKEAEITVELTDKNGRKTVEGSFVPEVTANGEEVTLVFSAGNTELSFQVPCMMAYENDGSMTRLNISNYLVTKDCAFDRTKDYTTVTAKTAEAQWIFANRLPAEGAYVEIIPSTEGNRFDGLTVTLTDSEDSDISVTVSLQNTDISNSVIRAGGKSAVMKSLFYPQDAGSEVDGSFRVSYKKQSIYVNDTCIAIEETDLQKLFEGFPSGNVYLTVAFENAVPGEGSYKLKTICEQIINNSSSDRTTPLIVLPEEYGGTADFGSVLSSKAAVIGDVLDPDIKAGLTVTAPSGEIVKAENGVLLENVEPSAVYSFRVSEYGQYLFTFNAEDSSERSSSFSYAVTVDDLVKPVVTVKDKFQSEVALGQNIKIPDFTVSDNVTAGENLKVAVYVFTSDGRMVTLPEGTGGYKPARTGVYEVRIVAADEAGNIETIAGRIKVQ